MTGAPQTRLAAANDNPGGETETGLAIEGLVALLARAEARRGAQAAPANAHAAPTERTAT